MKKTLRILASLLLSILLACSLPLYGCGSQDEEETPYPYDWSNLSFDGSGRAIYGDDSYSCITGIDVSEHQGFIDWKAVSQDGIGFAVVRIGYRGTTEGTLNMDSYFPYNSETSQAAGLKTCGYFFTQATNAQEGAEEAEYALSLLKDNPIDGFVAFDFEPGAGGRLTGISSEDATAAARAFCDVIEKAGYQPMIYANASDIQYFEEELLGEYPIWLANYTTDGPSDTIALTCWQYTSSGHVNGLDTKVDMNIWFRPVSE